MPALELTFALGGIRPAVDQVDRQPRANTLQGVGAVGRAVVDHQFGGQPALQHRLLEHPLDVESRFAQTERTVRDEPGRIVHQRHQIDLTALPLQRQRGAMQDIAIPNTVRKFCDKAAVLFRPMARATRPR